VRQITTSGIILHRTNYAEADRIITLLTPDHGKLTLIAKGVRKVKSKLAGGIELFSVSSISFIKGRGEIGTLTSTRLITHYSNIAKNVDRTMLGYNLIKQIDKVTEDQPESEWFELLDQTFRALDDGEVELKVIQLWFSLQMLKLSGHAPNLQLDASGEELAVAEKYNFDHQKMAFIPFNNGMFKVNHIKFLRLIISGNKPILLQKVSEASELAEDCLPISRVMLESNLRV
jgi:DNA repair protein RecO (recombination protein O)